jgi:hypothetical protein
LRVEDYARTGTRADAHEVLDICCNPENLGGMKRKKANQRKPPLELQIDLGDLDKGWRGKIEELTSHCLLFYVLHPSSKAPCYTACFHDLYDETTNASTVKFRDCQLKVFQQLQSRKNEAKLWMIITAYKSN